MCLSNMTLDRVDSPDIGVDSKHHMSWSLIVDYREQVSGRGNENLGTETSILDEVNKNAF